MGYDCTLHLVDPASFGRFADWFLGRPCDATKFERAFDAQMLRASIIGKLAAGPEHGGRAVVHGALMFCSAEAPHIPMRGLCFGLWHKLELGIADELPSGLMNSDAAEVMLAPIVEAYPALRHHLYTGIDQNYAVGHYVPPDGVTALRAHVERTIEHARTHDQDYLEKISSLLLAAESRGLGYWEATDLEVANGNPAWLRPKRGAAAAKRTSKPKKKPAWPAPRTIELDPANSTSTLSHERGGIVLAAAFSKRTTSFIDANVDPPVVRTLPVLIEYVAPLPDGRLVGFASRDRTPGSSLVEIDPRAPSVTPVTPAIAWQSGHVVAIGERVLAVPGSQELDANRTAAVWLDDRSQVRIDEPSSTDDLHAFDFAGTALLFRRQGYLVTGTHVEVLPTPRLRFYLLGDAPQGIVTDDGKLLVAAADPPSPGIRYVEDQPKPRLVTISRSGEVAEVLPELRAAYPALPGPDGAVIVRQNDPLEKDLLKVYWHRTREVASIPHAVAGVKKGACRGALYCPSFDELWISFDSRLVRIAWSVIAALPRMSATDFAAAHHATIAENARAAHERKWAAIRAKKAYAYDDPEGFFYDDEVIEHPQLGRGLIVGYTTTEYVAELADGSRHTFPRPARPGT
jgi:hypothetical protein